MLGATLWPEHPAGVRNAQSKNDAALISDALNDVVTPDQSIAQGSVAAFLALL
jgi:hypothetical protein